MSFEKRKRLRIREGDSENVDSERVSLQKHAETHESRRTNKR
jgi:hypothetical protein